MSEIFGRISSEESMGLLDGPGIRYVVFLQGCQLRCLYCHNPETWAMQGESYLITPQQLVEKICRYKPYFGKDGGVTFSGGEPLLQPKFLLECLKLCKSQGVHTALDTAGVGFGDYGEILKYTDLVILDVKAVEQDEYKKITGKPMAEFKRFLSACQLQEKPMWIRQVIVPNLNDDTRHIQLLKDFIAPLKNVQKVELLPYKTIGLHKYQSLNLPNRLGDTPDMDEEKCKKLEELL